MKLIKNLGKWIAILVLINVGMVDAKTLLKQDDYRLDLTGQSLALSYQNERFAEITGFAFNFIPARISKVISADAGKVVLQLDFAEDDGYQENFPSSIQLTLSYREGGFHFLAGHDSFNHVTIELKDQNEHYFGLIEKLYPGNRKSPDLRGETVDVEVYALGEKNYGENYASAYSAFYISSAGYGSFFDTFAKGQYRFAQNGKTEIYHQTDTLDWHLFHGEDGAAIHQAYFGVIGAPKSLPMWALGPVVWRDHNGGGKAQILDDLTRFADLKIPLTATFVDRPYSDGGHEWSKMNFTAPFANPRQWIKTINDDFGMEFMSWVGPMTFGDQEFPGLLPNYRSYIDLTHPEALAEFQKRLSEQQYSVGVKGHKMDRADENFPVTARWHEPVTESESRNKYVYLYAKVIDQFLRDAHGKDQFNFARSAYHRAQPYLSAIWGGDVRPTWQGMASNQANAIRAGFMGFPVWGSDTGGYLGEGYIDETLYGRWLQWSAWSGMFEIKLDGIAGSGEDRPPWRYSEKLQAIFRTACEQRMQLLPYAYSLANTSAANGVLMKPLAYVYPKDPATYALWDEYIFGDAFLVAPIFSEKNEREIYLPVGRWHALGNPQKVYQGPETITQKVSEENIPVFVKANSVYVTGDIYRGSSKRWRGPITGNESVTLHVFPGSAGESVEFTYVDYLDNDQHKLMALTHNTNAIVFRAPALTIDATLEVYVATRPERVELNGQPVTVNYDKAHQLLRVSAPKDQAITLSINGG